MGITSLSAALSGLRVAQEQLATISTDIANASTAGYTDKTLPQYSRAIAGVSVGVSSGIITRSVDMDLTRDMWNASSAAQSHSVRQAYLERIEASYGKPEDEVSFAAKIARLRDAFTVLVDSPEDKLLQSQAMARAEEAAAGLRTTAQTITTLRNDVQGHMESTVQRVNSLLVQVAESNNTILSAANVGRSTAAYEDQRDEIMRELSSLIGVSFYQRGDGVMVVKSLTNEDLASETARQLTFRPTPLAATNAYPWTAGAVYIGNPVTDGEGAIDITASSIGGELGGLIALRDEDLPQQMAQMDELAYRLASRMDAQGLTLFTNRLGVVPAEADPDPAADPPVAVPYVGFASLIRVNPAITDDLSLLQRGTAGTDLSAPPGSSAVLRRVVDYAFGAVSHQQATGTADIRATANGATDLREWLGVHATNTLRGTRAVGSVGDLMAAPGSPFTPAGADTFRIILDPAGESAGPLAFDVDVNAVAPAGSATAVDLAAHISALHTDITATVDGSGRLVLTSPHDIELADVDMGAAGFAFLGLAAGTYDAADPYIDVQVGTDAPVRIAITPGMDEDDLIDALILDPAVPGDTGVPGLAYDADAYAASGVLILRPGDSFANPTFGGALAITSGPFTATGAGGSGAPAGASLVSALFGSYDAGPPVQNLSPSADVAHAPFRSENLGPGANTETAVRGASGIVDYAQRVIGQQATTLISVSSQAGDAQALADLLATQRLNESGVNVDEELANMIVIQTAFAASARIVSAVQRMFDELLEAV